jgi:hypothetical protein
MPTWRKKPPNDHNVNKRSTAQQHAALADAAQLATARLYADVLDFWTICSRGKCRRHHSGRRSATAGCTHHAAKEDQGNNRASLVLIRLASISPS